MTEEQLKKLPANMRALESNDVHDTFGYGYAVLLSGMNVVKGVVGNAEVKEGVTYYRLFATQPLAAHMWDEGCYSRGLVASVTKEKLFPTRRSALESLGYEHKVKPMKPDSRIAGAIAAPEQRKPMQVQMAVQNRYEITGRIAGRDMTANEVEALRSVLASPCPIFSLLENDLYKYSMGQFVLHRFPRCDVRVQFTNRDGYPLGFLKPVLNKWLDELCKVRYDDGEIDYLRTKIPWLSSDFIDYLRRFYLFRDQIHVDVDARDELVMYAEGPWRDVIWFEVPCLALVAEARSAYFAEMLTEEHRNEIRVKRSERLQKRMDALDELYSTHPFTIAEFGLRRRSSAEWEEHVVAMMAARGSGKWFAGTSNVRLARRNDVRPSGTMAHELFMGLQGVGIQLRQVQKATWDMWMQEFRGKNGIMLTDPFGAMQCFKDMDWYVANSFQGFRHDSGDPIMWGELLYRKLCNLGIDPATKTFVWSDSLNMEMMRKIAYRFSHRVKVSFGVGTWLVHDCAPIAPANIVMKLSKSNGQDVLKLPDSNGKQACMNMSLVKYAKSVYEFIELPRCKDADRD